MVQLLLLLLSLIFSRKREEDLWWRTRGIKSSSSGCCWLRHLDGGIVGVDIHNGELYTSVFVKSRGCAITGCVAFGLVVEASSTVVILVLVIIIIQGFYCCYIMTFCDLYLKGSALNMFLFRILPLNNNYSKYLL